MAKAFSAQYKGKCADECGSSINVGDTVIYVDDKLVHDGCSTDTKRSSKPEIICKSCWLVKPCDCED